MQLPQTVEVRGIRVLTSKQLAECYKAKESQIKQNFSNNRERFVEGKHYISFTGDELRVFKNQVENFDLVASRTSHLYLWTEKGALLHAKSLNTDKAWEVYDYLVDFYFRAKKDPEPPKEELTYREKREAALAEVRAKAAEKRKELNLPEPISKPMTRMVVDIPDNVKAQQTIREIRQCLGAIEILIGESNRYVELKTFKEKRTSVSDAFMALVPRMRDYQQLEPKLIEQLY